MCNDACIIQGTLYIYISGFKIGYRPCLIASQIITKTSTLSTATASKPCRAQSFSCIFFRHNCRRHLQLHVQASVLPMQRTCISLWDYNSDAHLLCLSLTSVHKKGRTDEGAAVFHCCVSTPTAKQTRRKCLDLVVQQADLSRDAM